MLSARLQEYTKETKINSKTQSLIKSHTQRRFRNKATSTDVTRHQTQEKVELKYTDKWGNLWNTAKLKEPIISVTIEIKEYKLKVHETELNTFVTGANSLFKKYTIKYKFYFVDIILFN